MHSKFLAILATTLLRHLFLSTLLRHLILSTLLRHLFLSTLLRHLFFCSAPSPDSLRFRRRFLSNYRIFVIFDNKSGLNPVFLIASASEFGYFQHFQYFGQQIARILAVFLSKILISIIFDKFMVIFWLFLLHSEKCTTFFVQFQKYQHFCQQTISDYQAFSNQNSIV